MQKSDKAPGVPPSTGEERATATRIEERGGSVNPASPPDSHKDKKGPIEKREEALDKALDDTFPGSDPVSITPKTPEKPKT